MAGHLTSAAHLTRSARNAAWMERHLRIGDGPKIGRPVEVFPYMRADFELLWDQPVKPREVIISRSRKALKSFEVALILLCNLFGPEADRGSQLYSVANSRKQAEAIGKMMAQIIAQSPSIRDASAIVRGERVPVSTVLSGYRVENRILDIKYEPLSARPQTAHGRNPKIVVFDEIGAWNDEESELYSVMTSGSMLQESPTFLLISTQAGSDRAFFSQKIDLALANAELDDDDPEKDPFTLVRLDTAPMDLDWWSLEAARAANPAFDYVVNKTNFSAAVRAAKRSASELAKYRWLQLNQRVSTRNRFVSYDTWRIGNRPVAADWSGFPVVGGLDLATSADLVAFVLLARLPHEWQAKVWAWLPDEGLDEKSKRDGIAWTKYRDEEALLTTPGPTVDFEIVAQTIFRETQGLDIRSIACDPHRLNDLRQPLLRAGFSEEDALGKEGLFRIHRQNRGEMTSALNALEPILLRGDLAHGGHPVLGVCADNALVKYSPDGGLRWLEKKYAQHGGRIDAMVALAMAANFAAQGVEATPAAGSYLDDEGSEIIWA